ncbi:MAG: M23 family metallopeptidase [Halieaceae bacterium]|jgi:murein DD-endopeptidase MepM/ murein hydrolase activator NlpD|nr:M23 family metallopeptidase [Halieaceae bacterium]
MKVIFLNRSHSGSLSIELGRWSRAFLSLCCLGLPLGLITGGFLAGQEAGERSVRDASLDSMADQLKQQADVLAGMRDQAELKLQALTLNLAGLQARMTRLDALGEHLTVMADLEEGEFDFGQPPALGGPLALGSSIDFSSPDIAVEIDSFAASLVEGEYQLEILESLLNHRMLAKQSWLSGRPIEKGWISSYFGQRTDPFSGQMAMHNGLDFAGKEGSDVISVAGGVVTWAGARPGYGEMVELSHGDGFVTRYGHNKENLVVPGELVKKGQTIALMGSSGRSTGAHVHYEVYKNGRPVDPASYVHRTPR